MRRLILVLNGKGGVGKSFFSINLVQYLKDRGIAHASFDTDNENSTLKRFHSEAQFIDLAEPRQLDRVFEAKAPVVVVDARAASTDLFLDHFAEIDLMTVLGELKAQLTLAIPVNHEADSVAQVQHLVRWPVQYLIVRNAVHSPSFALYESLAVRKELLDQLGAHEIDLPRLQPWLVEALSSESRTITGAMKDPAFTLLDRQRLLAWQRRVYASLDGVQSFLLPEGGGA